MNRWLGDVALSIVVAATAIQVDGATLTVIVTVVVVPCVAAFWREVKLRIEAQSEVKRLTGDCTELQKRLDDYAVKSPDVHAELVALRSEVARLAASAADGDPPDPPPRRSPTRAEDVLRFPTRRSTPRQRPRSRSSSPFRRSAPGSGDS